jgi:hypothetical protein
MPRPFKAADLSQEFCTGGLSLANGGRDGIGERVRTGLVMGVPSRRCVQ